MNTRRFLVTTIAAVAAIVLPAGTVHAQKNPSITDCGMYSDQQ